MRYCNQFASIFCPSTVNLFHCKGSPLKPLANFKECSIYTERYCSNLNCEELKVKMRYQAVKRDGEGVNDHGLSRKGPGNLGKGKVTLPA